MVTDPEQNEARPKPPMLKVEEPKINVVTPWTDDKLDREMIADRLTKVIEDQQAPFVISLDGRWGTGKTFLLKRWHQELQNKRFQAIYFNAWEDDFCDDPLLAIIGQLSEHFHDGSFRDLAFRVANLGLGLITKQLTGTAMDVTDFAPESLLDDYHEQRRTKQEMKEQISALADQVRQETGKPLVFIIDELDRCRPTFAIELLERVKHIFEVPNIVFVFGINRSDLVKSLESVYGKIDAGVYLRRFFDMEFNLLEPDAQTFCEHLVARYRLDSFFQEQSAKSGKSKRLDDFRSVTSYLPLIVGYIGLSLRDIDYCIRLLALASRLPDEHYASSPHLFALLVVAKISNPKLYQRVAHGNGRAAELIDFINERHLSQGGRGKDPDNSWNELALLEAMVYYSDHGPIALSELDRLMIGAELGQPEYLAKATRKMQPDYGPDKWWLNRVSSFLKKMIEQRQLESIDLPSLAQNIDIYSKPARR